MRHKVVFAIAARQDLIAIYDFIQPHAGGRVARDYVARIYEYCLGFETFPERGILRDDIRQGLRIVGFRRKATIAFTISAESVTILRVFYNGQGETFEEGELSE